MRHYVHHFMPIHIFTWFEQKRVEKIKAVTSEKQKSVVHTYNKWMKLIG